MYQQPFLPEEVHIPTVEFVSPEDNPISYIRGVRDGLTDREFGASSLDQLKYTSRNVKDAYQRLDNDLKDLLFQEYADVVMDLAHMQGNLRARMD